MKPYLLETKEVTKIYRNNGVEVNALRGINLQIKAGEFVIVMGPSGCGKSTLLHILGGLESPTSGTVYVNQEKINALSEGQRAVMRRKQIGFVFQAYNLIGNLTVLDNIELPALVAGSSRGQARGRSEELITSLGIQDKGKSIPSQLSGGEKQRVALARALVNQPLILLADEPTGNLDSKAAMEVLQLLRQTHQDGQTILLVTHDPHVASIGERVIFMKDGQITHQTTLEDQSRSKELLKEIIEMEM